jgi:hypothetical protein
LVRVGFGCARAFTNIAPVRCSERTVSTSLGLTPRAHRSPHRCVGHSSRAWQKPHSVHHRGRDLYYSHTFVCLLPWGGHPSPCAVISRPTYRCLDFLGGICLILNRSGVLFCVARLFVECGSLSTRIFPRVCQRRARKLPTLQSFPIIYVHGVIHHRNCNWSGTQRTRKLSLCVQLSMSRR